MCVLAAIRAGARAYLVAKPSNEQHERRQEQDGQAACNLGNARQANLQMLVLRQINVRWNTAFQSLVVIVVASRLDPSSLTFHFENLSYFYVLQS